MMPSTPTIDLDRWGRNICEATSRDIMDQLLHHAVCGSAYAARHGDETSANVYESLARLIRYERAKRFQVHDEGITHHAADSGYREALRRMQ